MRPKLRDDLEILIVEEEDGERSVILRDPEQYASDVVRLEMGTLGLLRYFDGSRDLEDIRVALLSEGAGMVSIDELTGFAEYLDRLCLLDSERHAAERRWRAEFTGSSLRRPTHRGSAYPEDRAEARSFLDGMLDLAEEVEGAPLARLIAPHIDLGLGAEVYAHANRCLAAADRPDVVVVLGVCHAACERRFIACRKDFETPFGVVRFDAPLIDAIEERLGEDPTKGDLAHISEHSVEFQALWLAHHWPDDPPTMVPFLLRGFHEEILAGTSPSGDEEIERFVGALKGAIGDERRRVLVLASVDLAHVGPIYDHPEGLDEAGERALEDADRALLDHVLGDDAEGFFAELARDENARQVCGVAPIYVTLRLGEGGGRLLRYGQGRIHPESGSVVSYAAVAFAS